ncbi:polysaccharide biosynthesis protein [Oceanicola sp. 22II-s10i]|uniref:polysaccharide biosynthesis/export family protein n=1 Tax=Oceanicola sp. 22II-s10i TaxID=1317116 RepID=UPI000B5265A9|nr:polysaccharide biosynthesis/export family protein [Oceanicola sp. 22II-s10i]OWU85811.1 polysaccharide biosynthesis protein [Oceanicola sp. 22II-s10i]
METRRAQAVIGLVIVLLTAACGLPRGAALQSEIVKEADTKQPTFDVVDVTRDSVARIKTWPVTGTHEGYSWPNATRGPRSQVIRPGDRLDLVIWDSEENSLLSSPSQKTVAMQGLVVSPSGTIFVPYVDEIVVNGQTPEQARRDIQDKLNTVLPSSQVQIAMTEGAQNSADLVSGIAKPGSYPIPNRDTRILSLISLGGGISPSVRNPVVRLMRDGRSYRIPAKELLANPARNVLVRGGDQVIVEADDRYFTALGASGTEELIYFDRETVTALEAMSMVGGLSETRANPQGVLVLREYPAKTLRADGKGPKMTDTVFVIDLTSADGLFAARNFRIYPGDTIYVTESALTVANTVFAIIGRLFFFESQLANL